MSERRLAGTGVSPLSGVGTVRWYDPEPALPDPPAEVDPDRERDRFRAAQESVDEALAAERDRVAERIGEEEAAVFDAHRQFLTDPEIESAVEAAIDDGTSAPHAVEEAFADAIDRLESMDGMMSERADDLRDVRDRLLRALLDADDEPAAFPSGTVLLAERLTPSDTAGLDPEQVAGIATERGGRTSHAAIIARSLGLPAVVGVGETLGDVADGTRVVVDGDAGTVVVDPDEEAVAAATREATVAVRHGRVSTGDGREIEVAANVGSPEEAVRAAEQGADGVGLLRTERLFLDRSSPPDEDAQVAVYEQVLSAFDPGERVVVRTLDVGADKPVEYLDLDPDRNGFLGARGIRLSLSEHEALFETQLRALCRAAAADGAGLAVMFPMVTTVNEIAAAMDRLDAVVADLEREGIDHAVPELGAMVETPAATDIADAIAKRVSFLSLGTNDLAGYAMAARRDVDRVTDLHDPLHPGVLRAIDRTVRHGHEHDAWVGMCGEMAGDPDLTELLVGLGLDELSVSAVAVPQVKANVEATDAGEAETLAERALAAETREEVRTVLSRGD